MKKKKQHLKVLEQNGDREGIDFSSFYGCYEKMMRKKLGYSLENVSRDLYISKGSLSEMENGIRPMKKELFDRFLSTYDMEFSEDFCIVAKLKEVLIEEVDAFL